MRMKKLRKMRALKQIDSARKHKSASCVYHSVYHSVCRTVDISVFILPISSGCVRGVCAESEFKQTHHLPNR